MLVIGKANQYYTLWSKSDLQEVNDGYEVNKFYNYTYLKNISTDLEKVREEYPDLEINENLRGTSYREYIEKPKTVYTDGVFGFGKYTGKKFSEVPVTYLKWFYENTELYGDAWAWYQDNVKSIEAILEENDYKVFPETHQAILKDNIIESHFEAPEVLEVTAYTQLSDTGVFLTENMLIKFSEYKKMFFRDFEYGLPILNGKAKKIKGKTLRITDYDYEIENIPFTGYNKTYTEQVVIKVKSWEIV